MKWSSLLPNLPAIDWGNPLTRGLVSLVNGYSGDLVTKSVPLTSAGTRSASTHGLSDRFSSGGSSFSQYTTPRSKIGSACTYLILCDWYGLTGNSFIFGDVEASSTGFNAGLYSNGVNFLFFVMNTGGTSVSASGSTASNTTQQNLSLAGTYDGANVRIYVRGKLEATSSQSGAIGTNAYQLQLNRWNGASMHDFSMPIAALWNRALSPSEIAAISATPGLLFLQSRKNGYGAPVSSGTTGASSTTNANDTSAASGRQTNTGSLARANANDTSSAVGNQTNTGTLSKTNANDTLSASGSSGVSNSGTSSTTNANDTSAASGRQTNTGALARANNNDTSAASGNQTNTGSLSRTNNNDIVSAQGFLTTSGSSNTTNGNDTCVAFGTSGAVGAPVGGGGWQYSWVEPKKRKIIKPKPQNAVATPPVKNASTEYIPPYAKPQKGGVSPLAKHLVDRYNAQQDDDDDQDTINLLSLL